MIALGYIVSRIGLFAGWVYVGYKIYKKTHSEPDDKPKYYKVRRIK